MEQLPEFPASYLTVNLYMLFFKMQAEVLIQVWKQYLIKSYLIIIRLISMGIFIEIKSMLLRFKIFIRSLMSIQPIRKQQFLGI